MADPVTPTPVARKRRPGPQLHLTWREEFLTAYEACGGFYAAAKTAGVNSSTVYDEMGRDPAFKARTEEAKQRYADSREANLARLADNGNVVGDIVLLKKFRPAEYIEKNLSITASFSAELDHEGGQRLLEAMLHDMTSQSHQRLEGVGLRTAIPAGDDGTSVPTVPLEPTPSLEQTT